MSQPAEKVKTTEAKAAPAEKKAAKAKKATKDATRSRSYKAGLQFPVGRIHRMLKDGNGRAEEDMRARELREQQVEARRLLESTRSALDADGDLLNAEERAEIDRLAEALAAAAAGEDVEAVKAGIAALTKGTETFAERRMDRSIREALSGMSVDDALFDEKPAEEDKH